MLGENDIQVNRVDPKNQVVETDPRERMILKAQRNYLLKMYEVSMNDINVYDSIYQSFSEKWRDLNNRPQPLSLIEQFEKKVIEAESHIYEVSLKRVKDKIKEWNEELSCKIIDLNIKLGYDEVDLYDKPEMYEDDDSEDSDYEGDDETPNNYEQINNDDSGYVTSESDDQ